MITVVRAATLTTVLFLCASAFPTATRPATDTPAACADPEHRQFDFWVGRWDVYPTGGTELIARSVVEKVYGCGIREEWTPLAGHAGGSLGVYVPGQRRWEQFWIDSGGSRTLFTGGRDGKAMVVRGESAGRLVRMSYSRNADGSVRRKAVRSNDDGRTWKPDHDFTYRPATNEVPGDRPAYPDP